MKSKNVEVGQYYFAKIKGKIRSVQVKGKARRGWKVRNINDSCDETVRSAAKLAHRMKRLQSQNNVQ